MLNIEKYKDEILKYVGCRDSLMCLIYENIMKKNDCTGCCSKCKRETIEWLTSEYKEPILTDKEKAYLKNVVEPKKDDVLCIRKWRFYEGTKQEYTTVTIYEKHPTSTSDNSYWTLLDFVVTDEMPFKGMELEKVYSLEELGL